MSSVLYVAALSVADRHHQHPFLRRRAWKRGAGAERVSCSVGRGVGRRVFEGDVDLGHVERFEMSDFSVRDSVSVGLAGKTDEMIFEAAVTNPESPLYDTRVVLRQLRSVQARRRGLRALQVLKKLARRQLMYHSYAMRVHGYVSPPTGHGEDGVMFTLVHGYHGSYSLRHWLRLSDWLPTLEATLALDEEWVRRIGDDSIGGPAVTRQLRLTRILMRDLLIGVNYLHSHGLAHTELRLENVHICPVDRHIKVGILGNAADLHDKNLKCTRGANTDRRRLMIAYDMRCVGFMMAKMVLRELMDPNVFSVFKSFLYKENSPSCLREFFLRKLCQNSPTGNIGLQILDRNWGAGWNLLSLLLATKPSERISCLAALRHPFLCGPKWRVEPSMDFIRWNFGSAVVRVAEEYIYDKQQRSRIAYFIELMEMLNPHPQLKNWLELLPGRWRLIYSTGRHIGLTLRQGTPRVLIGNAYLTFKGYPESCGDNFTLVSDIGFKVIPTLQWPHEKSGPVGTLQISAQSVKLMSGRALYLKEETDKSTQLFRESMSRKLTSRKWKRLGFTEELPSSVPACNLSTTDDINISMELEAPSTNKQFPKDVLREVRIQIPPEIFDISKIVCGTYLDSRLMILRAVNGSALLFVRSC